jgi:nucleotide-binding universal stress UspA family protein
MTDSTESTPSFVVVGIDGSDEAEAALRWAASQAELTGAELRVVTAWHVPAMAYGSGSPIPVDTGFERASQEVLDRAVKEVHNLHAGVAVSTRIVQGPSAPVLLEAATGAALLVVGSRGHGAFAGMLLGSVSEHCVTHADCPVVVVRAKKEGGPRRSNIATEAR